MYIPKQYAEKYTLTDLSAQALRPSGTGHGYIQIYYTTFKRKLQHKKLAFSSFLMYNLIKGKCKIFN